MSKANQPRPRLGRGLSSLLSFSDASSSEGSETAPTARPGLDDAGHSSSPPPAHGTAASEAGAAVLEIAVESILPNPQQPRRDFNESSIAELAASLKSTGLIQPIVVRPTPHGYELIAGERRLRAAKVAGLMTLPAIVKDVDGYTQAQMALIENVQREDLNPVERALAYRSLIDQLGLTQSELAGRLGEDRTGIAHYLRLLDLDSEVREHLQRGKLSLGHGKLLAGVSNVPLQRNLAERVISQGLSVRNLERLIDAIPSAEPTVTPPPETGSSAHLRDLEKSMSQQLGMRVQLRWSAKRRRGKLTITYTLEQFDQLKDRLGLVTE